MQFSSVIGQDKLKKHLTETYRSERTAHAQIFLGPEGSGNLALALAYAQYLQCENPNEVDSCGQCNACRKVSKNIHPDLHYSFPTIGTGKISNDFLKEWREMLQESPYLNVQQWLIKIGAENQQGNITKNECVDIVRKFSFKKVEGNFKILILWMPEFLEKEGNRLLKLIEEPEPDTVFILVAERSEKILNTILSRCQLVKIPALQDEEIAAALIQEQKTAAPKAQQISYLVEGNYTKALQLLTEDASDTNYQQIFVDWLRACFKGGPELVYWVEYFVTGSHPTNKNLKGEKTGRKEHVLFLQHGLFFLRELMLLKAMGEAAKLRLGANEQKAAMGLSNILSLPQLEKLMHLLDDSIYFVERNANSKILFMDASLQICRIFKPLK